MGIPVELIEEAKAADLLTVAERCGARLRRAGSNEFAGPCPVCGGKDRFSINVRRRVFNCRQCGVGGDAIALIQHVDSCGFGEAIQKIIGRSQTPARPRRPIPAAIEADVDEARRLERALAKAKRIASEIVPVAGTPGETNLRDIRKIDVTAIEDVLSRRDAIGWHPAVYFNEPGHLLHGQRLGCIVAIMTDPVTAEPTGAISRTYLAPDGTKVGKAKTLGAPMGIVRLTPDDEVLEGLHLAEGLETALAGMARWAFRPMWSTGTCGLMAGFPVLSGIETITVMVDHDLNGAGEKAAREIEARWQAAGREVKLIQPIAPGDLNDIIIAENSK